MAAPGEPQEVGSSTGRHDLLFGHRATGGEPARSRRGKELGPAHVSGDRELNQHVDEIDGKREMARTYGPDQCILSGAAGNRNRFSTRRFGF
jgi:hypothetical protein